MVSSELKNREAVEHLAENSPLVVDISQPHSGMEEETAQENKIPNGPQALTWPRAARRPQKSLSLAGKSRVSPVNEQVYEQASVSPSTNWYGTAYMPASCIGQQRKGGEGSSE